MWKQVIAPIAVVSALWVAVTCGTMVYVEQIDASYKAALSRSVLTVDAVGVLRETLWDQNAAVLAYVQRGDSQAKKSLERLNEDFQEHARWLESHALGEREQEVLKLVRQDFASYSDVVSDCLQRFETGGPAPVGLQQAIELRDAARMVADDCKELVAVNKDWMQTITQRRDRIRALINSLRLCFLIAGPGIGLYLGFRAARGLHRSISQISIILKEATAETGESLAQIEVDEKSQLPELHQQVQVVAARIREIMESLQQARSEMIQAERLAAVGELAAGVAHELRNPLTSVKLLIQTGAQNQPDLGLRGKSLAVVQEEIKRMETTIQGLLDFARPSTMRRIRHNLFDTVDRALTLVQGRISQHGIRVQLEFCREPLPIVGDPEQLQQVFVNLLLNAIEAMPRGGTLTLAASRDSAVKVVVSDSGPGIAPSVLEHVFEPFVTTKERGTGLGLPISLRIVRDHGGRLTCVTGPAGGAVFTLELPLAPAVSETSDSTSEASKPPTSRTVEAAAHA